MLPGVPAALTAVLGSRRVTKEAQLWPNGCGQRRGIRIPSSHLLGLLYGPFPVRTGQHVPKRTANLPGSKAGRLGSCR
jgi:hypothetical protein